MNISFSQGQTDTISIMTFNIRLDLPSDSLNSRVHRKEIAADVFNKFNIDAAGVQEALYSQIEDFEKLLPGYKWFGVGRDDGNKGGEFSAILYKKNKLKLLTGNTFWLSETPDAAGSRGWDAAYNRICTWGKFEDINTGQTFFIFNTHLDNSGELARQEGTSLILKRIKKIAGDGAVILICDFNCIKNSVPYNEIQNDKSVNLRDAEFVDGVKKSGPEWSFHGFESVKEKDRIKIDFIFINNKVKVLSHSVLDFKEKGKYPSDHLPVKAGLIIQN